MTELVTTAAADDPTLWNVVEEHFDESEFLLERWVDATRSPRLSVVDIQRPIEHRLVAHVDGLAVGGPLVADRLLWPVFGAESDAPPARVAAAALAVLSDPGPSWSGWRDSLGRVLELLGEAAPPAVARGIGTALTMTPRTDVDEPMRQTLYGTTDRGAHIALLTALAARRVDAGPIVATFLQRTDQPALLAAALRAAASSERGQVRHLIEPLLTHPEATVRAEALRAGLILNLDSAWRLCPTEARQGSTVAMVGLALFGASAELNLLASLARSGPHRRAAIRALGASGRPDAVDLCLPLLADPDPKVAALAFEAAATITDLPWSEPPYLAPPEPEADLPLPPLEEDLETDLAPSEDDELPACRPAEVARWWTENRDRFRGDGRFLSGLPLSPATLPGTMLACPLRRLDAIMLDVAARTGGTFQIPALRLGFAVPAVRSDLRFTRPPTWS